MEHKPEPRPSITRVWAKNFRSIESAEIDLGPLTVLVGPNASGKSNCVDVLRFVADAWRDGLEVAMTRRGGIESIGRRPARGRAYGPEIGLQFEGAKSLIKYEFAIANTGEGAYRVKREYIKVQPKVAITRPLEIEVRNGKLAKLGLKRTRGIPKQIADRLDTLEQMATQQLDPKELSLTSNQTRWLPAFIFDAADPEAGYCVSWFDGITSLNHYLSEMRFYHIFPNVLRDPQKMGDRYPLEERGENLASVLQDMGRQKSPFFEDLKEALALVVPGIRDVRVTQAGSFLVAELKHGGDNKAGRQTWFDLSYESDGTLRLLGLLVALYQTPAPSLIAIEEPELTIHPGVLAVLADVMQEASLRSQILVTTHSPDLIDRLPIDCIRAVELKDGVTTVGPVAEYQKQSVREGLFLPGELHRMEGLQMASNEG